MPSLSCGKTVRAQDGISNKRKTTKIVLISEWHIVAIYSKEIHIHKRENKWGKKKLISPQKISYGC